MYQNYYLFLSLEQYKKDLSDFEMIKEEYNLINQSFNNDIRYEILITYIDKNNNYISVTGQNVLISEIENTVKRASKAAGYALGVSEET